MNETMLVLNLDPRLQEDLVDYLLGLPYVTGFTAYKVHGHGDHVGMSISEQVSGRRDRLQVEIILGENNIQGLLDRLAVEVGKGITYWQQLICNRGEVA